jgi:hypothetical protein
MAEPNGEEKPNPVKSPAKPMLTERRPSYRLRWILYLCVVVLVALACYYVGRHIVDFWKHWVEQI